MIIGIVAVDKEFGIGKNNGLLFKLPLDMQRFKKITSNDGIVAMGYNTLLSLPGSKPLPNRVNIVLCPEGIDVPDCICLHTFEETVSCIWNLSKSGKNVYIMGGAMFYKSMLPYYDLVYVTKVNAIGEAEVFFPNLDKDPDFKLVETSEVVVDNDYETTYCTYERIK